MTKKQIAWARSHDWFHAESPIGIYVVDRYTFNGHYHEHVILWQDSFSTLRIWAGY